MTWLGPVLGVAAWFALFLLATFAAAAVTGDPVRKVVPLVGLLYGGFTVVMVLITLALYFGTGAAA